VHVLSMPGGAWNLGASVLSFAFPLTLFILVASALYVVYTRPEPAHGPWVENLRRPMSYTVAPSPLPPAAGQSEPVGAIDAATADAGTADAGTADAGTAGDGPAEDRAADGGAGAGDGA